MIFLYDAAISVSSRIETDLILKMNLRSNMFTGRKVEWATEALEYTSSTCKVTGRNLFRQTPESFGILNKEGKSADRNSLLEFSTPFLRVTVMLEFAG